MSRRRPTGYALALGVATLFGAILLRGERPVTAQIGGSTDIRVGAFDVKVAVTDATFDLSICATVAPVSFRLRFWANPSRPPSCRATGADVDIPYSMPMAGCVETSFKLTGLSPGTYRPTIMVDADCSVRETDETNNIARAPFAIVSVRPVSYSTGRRKYRGPSKSRHASTGGLASMEADCNATYRGSRVCTTHDIFSTSPAPIPSESIWLVHVDAQQGVHSATNCMGPSGVPFGRQASRSFAYTLSPSGGVVKASCGILYGSGTLLTRARSLPAACCGP